MGTEKGVNILLVDDNKDKLLSIESILDDPELNLVKCGSGEEALRQLLSNDFAAILLDVKMPRIDGFETARMIRQRPRSKHTPIIFITAHSKNDLDAMKGYTLGAVDFITTPVVPVVLKAKVQAFVDLFKKTKQIERQNKELENLHEHLEEMVEERTAALQTEIAERKKAEKKIKESLREKEVLLAEVHHRVKNNMALVSGLLELEMSQLEDKELKKILLNSKNRIKSMAIVHEKLYQCMKFSEVQFGDYLEELVHMISASFSTRHADVRVETHANDVILNVNQAIPCALLLNELLNNAYKHAFRGMDQGEILVEISEVNEELTLKVQDNGVGLPEGFDMKDSKTLGMKLIQTLSKQLHGELTVQNEQGTCFMVHFLRRERSDSGSAHLV